MEMIITLTGKADQVFKLIALKAEREPNKTIGELRTMIRQEEQEPEMEPAVDLEPMVNTWTRYNIWTGGHNGKVLVDWLTNDDNDDGYADPDPVHATYTFDNLDKALKFTGKSRTGFYGQPVDVYLDGKRV